MNSYGKSVRVKQFFRHGKCVVKQAEEGLTTARVFKEGKKEENEGGLLR